MKSFVSQSECSRIKKMIFFLFLGRLNLQGLYAEKEHVIVIDFEFENQITITFRFFVSVLNGF